MWLGIDLGTSGAKALLLNDRQEAVATAHAPLSVNRPQPNWSEQEPEDWWAALSGIMEELAATQPAALAAVRGIGLSGHMHGATLLDASGRPLRPCILWNDTRSGEECRELEAAAPFREIGANLVMPGFTAPKLAWVRKHEPEVFEKTAKVLLPKDYLRLRLTGEYLSDLSDSAGTLWLDVARRRWSDELLAATGLEEGQMPGLVEGSEPAGRLRPELTERWGMSGRPVVAGGGGDNAAAACGVGVLKPGRGLLSLGSSGVIFVSKASCKPNLGSAVHTFCHAAPGLWHQMGVILAAGDSLNWLAGLTVKAPKELLALVDPAGQSSAPLVFLPYLSGERTPHNEDKSMGVFAGLGLHHGLPELTRALLEGVAFAFRDCLDALRATGESPESLFAVGGGARSDSWMQIVADVCGLRLERPANMEQGGALGAARLAICASEGADPLEVCAPQPVESLFEPNANQAAYYAEGLERYRALYPAARKALYPA